MARLTWLFKAKSVGSPDAMVRDESCAAAKGRCCMITILKLAHDGIGARVAHLAELGIMQCYNCKPPLKLPPAIIFTCTS